MPVHQVRDHCLAPARAAGDGSRYGRLFEDLPPLACDDDELLALGATEGPYDAGPPASDPEQDDAEGEAGWPVFAQFVAHDITADRSGPSAVAEVSELRNARHPRLDLEAVYGAGPVGEPFLYDREDPAKLLAGAGDVPRNAQGIALLGDPRNDVHLLVSQLHLAFLRLHNRIVDRLREDGMPEGELFEAARRATTWHYQWIVTRDFLPRLLGAGRAETLIADGPRRYRPGSQPAIPLEFADAAFRYGHGQIRRAYRLNAATPPVPLFPDLLGFRPVPAERQVDWRLFFGPEAQRAKRIDGRLPRSLMRLPVAITGALDVEAYASLAARDLQRGVGTGLPSGEAVARALGEEPLTPDEAGLAAAGWRRETPLWLYVLREAAVREDGDRLGPVGATIVGEVIVGLLDADPGSQRRVEPDWRPTLPARDGSFGLADALAFAGGLAEPVRGA